MDVEEESHGIAFVFLTDARVLVGEVLADAGDDCAGPSSTLVVESPWCCIRYLYWAGIARREACQCQDRVVPLTRYISGTYLVSSCHPPPTRTMIVRDLKILQKHRRGSGCPTQYFPL